MRDRDFELRSVEWARRGPARVIVDFDLRAYDHLFERDGHQWKNAFARLRGLPFHDSLRGSRD